MTNSYEPQADQPSESPAMDAVLRSHDVAELAGTTPRALRHYHAIGLLPEVPRDPNGYRRYSVSDLVRVLRIRQLADSGMPLRSIANALERDGQSYDELLAELDARLQDQAKHIDTQRQLVAELRRASAHNPWIESTERSTATRNFDQDVWTLVTGTDDIGADTASALLDTIQDESLAEEAGNWYREFEELESYTHLDHASAERLAHRIADFAATVVAITGLTPTAGELPVMALIEQMQSERLSGAQKDVWQRFLSIVDQRWETRADHEGGSRE
ncbi:MerR family transcriptional regulator [Microbacterium sp. MPKO10]|uniref:helix-turn-helix domain-containing protein n=1 Tax=Microbacterium sp. MPKO10 TaxID=2989818 RepID=UPI002235584A|nr:MerR family transcriptional regulator [Microbacterium sp. MPKO10]MCW4459575.1 MerR family transcriptional regulator [Microbacterium sp. MPKO10]